MGLIKELIYDNEIEMLVLVENLILRGAMFICISHIKEKSLRSLALDMSISNVCSVCNGTAIVIDTENPYIHTMIKALIRYNYDEFEYNGHFGGDHSILSMILEMNVFDDFTDEGKFLEELDGDFSNIEVYDDNGVSIHAGYYHGEQNTLLQAVKNNPSPDLIEIEKEIKTKNYHEFESHLLEVLDNYENFFAITVVSKDVFFRARTGFSSSRPAYGDWGRDMLFYNPYQEEGIGSVPVIKAGEGRANRVGVSYLYCATDEYTAVSEIRPHPGDIVSIGSFKPNKNLKIFDFSGPNLFKFYQNDLALDELKDYAALAYFFNKSTPPSIEGRYLVTQLIAEGIRRKGYDGILFSSTVGKGNNYVFFNPADLSYISLNKKALEIKKVEYSYSDCNLEGVDDKYVVYKDVDY